MPRSPRWFPFNALLLQKIENPRLKKVCFRGIEYTSWVIADVDIEVYKFRMQYNFCTVLSFHWSISMKKYSELDTWEIKLIAY